MVTESVIVPINRYPQGKSGRVNILEVLKVYWETGIYDKFAAATLGNGGITALLSTRNPQGVYPVMQDPSMIDYVNRDFVVANATPISSTFLYSEQDPIVHDLTDGAGHGLLVATDQIYLTLGTFAFQNETYVKCKIMYRYKSVTLTEYIGIVQSQQ